MNISSSNDFQMILDLLKYIHLQIIHLQIKYFFISLHQNKMFQYGTQQYFSSLFQKLESALF